MSDDPVRLFQSSAPTEVGRPVLPGTVVAASSAPAPASTPAPDEATLAQFRAMVKRDRDAARYAVIGELGPCKSPALTREQVLAIAPDVDPATTEGRAQLEAWHKANAGLFHQGKPPDPAAMRALDDVREVGRRYSGGALFSGESLVESVFGVTVRDPAAEKARERAALEAMADRHSRMLPGMKARLDYFLDGKEGDK